MHFCCFWIKNSFLSECVCIFLERPFSYVDCEHNVGEVWYVNTVRQQLSGLILLLASLICIWHLEMCSWWRFPLSTNHENSKRKYDYFYFCYRWEMESGLEHCVCTLFLFSFGTSFYYMFRSPLFCEACRMVCKCPSLSCKAPSEPDW